MRGPFSLRVSDGVTDRHVTSATRGMSFSKSAYGGDKGLQADVSVPLATFSGLGAGSPVELYDHLGRTVWGGEATNPGASTTPGGEFLSLVALGGANRMQAYARALAPVLLGTESWKRSSNSTKAANVSVGERGEGLATLEVEWAQKKDVGTNQRGELLTRAFKAAGLRIGGFHATAEAGLSNDDYLMQLRTGQSTASLSMRDSRPARTSSGSMGATLGGTIAVGDNIAAFTVMRNVSSRVATDDDWFRLWDFRVRQVLKDRFGVNRTTGYGVGTVLASEVIEDMVGRGMCPGMDPGLVSIGATAFPIDALAWLDGVTFGDACTALYAFEADLFWMASGSGGRFGLFDYAQPRYVIGRQHGGIEFPGSESDVKCNRVLVSWQDRKGDEQTLVVEVEVEGLSYRRDYLPGISLPPSFGSESNAARAGAQILKSVNAGTRAGRAAIRTRIMDEWQGCLVEPWEIEPGCVALHQETGELARVTDVAWNDTDGVMSVDLNRTPKSADQILARLKRKKRGNRR